METDTDDTAAWARIEDVAACAARVDAQVRVVLGRVLAQRRSAEVASGYVSALSPGTKANCWLIAEAAGRGCRATLVTCVYMPERRAADMQRRRAAGIPDDLATATKPELATAQVRRLLKTGLPIR